MAFPEFVFCQAAPDDIRSREQVSALVDALNEWITRPRLLLYVFEGETYNLAGRLLAPFGSVNSHFGRDFMWIKEYRQLGWPLPNPELADFDIFVATYWQHQRDAGHIRVSEDDFSRFTHGKWARPVIHFEFQNHYLNQSALVFDLAEMLEDAVKQRLAGKNRPRGQ